MNTVKIQLEIDLKQIKKAFILADIDVPSDEDILEKMGKEPTVIDLDSAGEDGQMAVICMAMMAIVKAYDMEA